MCDQEREREVRTRVQGCLLASGTQPQLLTISPPPPLHRQPLGGNCSGQLCPRDPQSQRQSREGQGAHGVQSCSLWTGELREGKRLVRGLPKRGISDGCHFSIHCPLSSAAANHPSFQVLSLPTGSVATALPQDHGDKPHCWSLISGPGVVAALSHWLTLETSESPRAKEEGRHPSGQGQGAVHGRRVWAGTKPSVPWGAACSPRSRREEEGFPEAWLPSGS